MNHDIVVIGASAGGLEVLLELVAELPVDFRAAMFVVLHLRPNQASPLPELLSARGRMPAVHPVHGDKIMPGTIYVAPPDNHVQLRPGAIEVVRGPKDNGHRPAVDVLFRTAAASHGARVIGVVLSGYQDCGTAGMMSTKARGGVAVVQDPASAVAAEMPRHVIERVAVDHVVHPRELPDLLARLVAMPAGATAEPSVLVQQVTGERAEVACPICDGVLSEGHATAFHAFTLESLVREQSEGMERVLWAAVRALEETAAIAQRVGLQETGELQRRLIDKEKLHRQQAEYLRHFLLYGKVLTPLDATDL